MIKFSWTWHEKTGTKEADSYWKNSREKSRLRETNLTFVYQMTEEEKRKADDIYK